MNVKSSGQVSSTAKKSGSGSSIIAENDFLENNINTLLKLMKIQTHRFEQ
jgi:hypothetical protein